MTKKCLLFIIYVADHCLGYIDMNLSSLLTSTQPYLSTRFPINKLLQTVTAVLSDEVHFYDKLDELRFLTDEYCIYRLKNISNICFMFLQF